MIHFLQQGFLAVGPFVILLGLLVFVHELGHFLVAKYFGVRVETFSLGFGKKLYQFKKGDTTYCISLIPLGGYVKMFGDEPNQEVPESEKPYSFSHKPLHARFLVVLAGPAMNFFFAILVFTVMALVGEQMLHPVLGDIDSQSPAFRAGFRSGDKIVAVDNTPVTTWEDAQDLIETQAGKELEFKINRESSHQDLIVRATPVIARNKNVVSHRTWVGEIEGLSTMSRAATVAVPQAESVVGKAGLVTGDTIDAVNSVEVSSWRSLEHALQEAVKQHPASVTLSARATEKGEETGSTKTVTINLPNNINPDNVLSSLGIESPELYLAEVIDGAPAQKAGMRANDRIVAVNTIIPQKWDDVVKTVKTFDPAQKTLSVDVVRNSEKLHFDIVPQMTKHMTMQGKEEERFTIGIVPTLFTAAPKTLVRRQTNPISALIRGTQLTWNWTQFTVMGFVRLIQKEVSPKSIGGVISIGQVASRSFEVGLAAFLSVMGIISVNLCIVNLLPVPVLDGGHLLFYTVEWLRGRPLSMRKLEIAQQVGLFVLFSLMAFALFNDFSRLLKFSW